MECPEDPDPPEPGMWSSPVSLAVGDWWKLTPSSLCLLSEPEPGAAAAEDAAGRPAAHCPADLWCPGTATASVPAAGSDLSSFHHTSAPDTASAPAAAATAERCSFGALLLGGGSLSCLVGDGYFLVDQKIEVIAEYGWDSIELSDWRYIACSSWLAKSPWTPAHVKIL